VLTKLDTNNITECLVAGSRIETWLIETIQKEFGAPVSILSLRDLSVTAPTVDLQNTEAEIAGCVGVFTG